LREILKFDRIPLELDIWVDLTQVLSKGIHLFHADLSGEIPLTAKICVINRVRIDGYYLSETTASEHTGTFIHASRTDDYNPGLLQFVNVHCICFTAIVDTSVHTNICL
jgi:hypothetical protein